jgi:hypothetical protein
MTDQTPRALGFLGRFYGARAGARRGAGSQDHGLDVLNCALGAPPGLNRVAAL